MEIRHLNTSLQDCVNHFLNKRNLERIKPTSQTLPYLSWSPSIAIAHSLRSTVGIIIQWVGFSQIRGLCYKRGVWVSFWFNPSVSYPPIKFATNHELGSETGLQAGIFLCLSQIARHHLTVKP
jgi:hypothetical protein